MRAEVGDWLITEALHLAERRRKGQIIEVRHADGSPPYLVHWLDDGRTSLFFPGPDTHIEHHLPQHLQMDTPVTTTAI